VPEYGIVISLLLAIVAVPESEMVQSPAIPDPVARAVALQFSVEPASAPCAVPDTCNVVKHVAVNVPATDDADCCVTVQRKFVHDVRSVFALELVETHWPPRNSTVGVGLLGALVRNSKHPALSTENTSAIANTLFVMAAVLPEDASTPGRPADGVSL
jgi:hypothetical protein